MTTPHDTHPAPDPSGGSANSSPLIRALLLAGAVCFAILGQLQLILAQNLTAGLLWWGIALAQWIVALRQPDTASIDRLVPPAPGPVRPARWTPARMLGLLAALILGGLAYRLAWEGRFTLPLLLAWGGAVGVTWWALDERAGDRPAFRLPRQLVIPLDLHTLAVTVILVLGAAALFYDLANLPHELISDHVENLRDVATIRDTGVVTTYMGNNSGREPLYFVLAAALTPVFGASFMAIKFVSAGAMFLTLPALYWAGRALGGRWLGVLAMGLGAGSVWAIIMGRSGFRAPLAALASALLLATLWRALQRGQRRDFLLVGVVLGVGLYGYTSFRVAPLLVLIGVGLRWLAAPPPTPPRPSPPARRGQAADASQTVGLSPLSQRWRRALALTAERRALLGHLTALVALSLALFVPLLAYWLRYPTVFWHRVQAFGQDAGGASGLGQLAQGFIDSLLLFTWRSDPVRLNVISRPYADGYQFTPVSPALGPVVGALCVLGMVAWLWLAARSRRALAWLLPLALLVFILPSALGIARPNEMPSARRAIAALPVVMLLAGVALWLPARALVRLAESGPGWRRLVPRLVGLLLVVAILLGSGALNVNDYATLYAAWYWHGSQPARAIAQEVRDFIAQGGSLRNVHLVYGETSGWVDPRAVSVWLGVPHYDLTLRAIDSLACPARDGDGPLLFILAYSDPATLAQLGACYPAVEAARYMLPSSTGFTAARVP